MTGSSAPLVLLPMACSIQGVNDKLGKILNLFFFFYFFWDWEAAFEKLQVFTFRQKQCFYLNHSAPEYFKKLALKKSKTRNFKQLYLKNSELIAESFWRLIQFSSKERCSLHALPTWVNDRKLRPLQPLVLLPVARSIQGVNDKPGKILILFLFLYFFWKWAATFKTLEFFHF